MSFTIKQFQRAAESRVDGYVGNTLDCWKVTDSQTWAQVDMSGLGRDLVERANNGWEDSDYDDCDYTTEDKFAEMLSRIYGEVDRWFDDYRDTLDISGFGNTVKALEYLAAHPSDIQRVDECMWFPVVTDWTGKIVERRDAEDTITAIADGVLWNRVYYMLECIREDVNAALDSLSVDDVTAGV